MTTKFFSFRDHRTDAPALEACPWEFDPAAEKLARMRSVPKRTRNTQIEAEGWDVYTPVRAVCGGSRVSETNPAVGLRGMVLDYDVKLDQERLAASIAEIPSPLRPQFVERSLSGNFRVVWVFEAEIVVPDSAFAKAVFLGLMTRVKAQSLSAGLDRKSEDPAQVWVNGVDWFPVESTPVSEGVVLETVMDVAKRFRPEAGSIPLEKIAAEVNRRWPGAWSGDFALNATGPRFWEVGADNPRGAMVKPTGMLCFTGPVGWVTWSEILGDEWVRKAQEERMSDAVEGIWFDGRAYWMQTAGGIWRPRSREDTLLTLHSRGLNPRVPKNETISEAGRVLVYLQNQRRVDAAAPLVNRGPGLQTVLTKTVLNTTRVRALPPAPEPCGPEKFPWLQQFLVNHFAEPYNGPLDHFLAWLQRGYEGLLNYKSLMGQAVFICGPKNNGKTLLALRVCRMLFGGVAADPLDHFCGRTPFTSDLYEVYFWSLNDADTPKEAERATLLAKIKDAVVNPTHSYHPKFCDRATIEATIRFLATLNDDPQAVGLLPEVNSNTADKMMFFRSQPYQGVFPANHELEAVIDGELPYFARWLLDWQAPDCVLERSRMGVRSYFDPKVLTYSRQQSSSYNLSELVSQWIHVNWPEDQLEWEGTPTKLLSSLGTCEPLVTIIRDWTVYRVAKALTTLARDPESGITLLETSGRNFRITRPRK
jgi:hypothetical protein